MHLHSFKAQFRYRNEKSKRSRGSTHAAEDDLLSLGVLQGVRVVRNVVALGLDFVPGGGVVFL